MIKHFNEALKRAKIDETAMTYIYDEEYASYNVTTNKNNTYCIAHDEHNELNVEFQKEETQ